MAGDVKVGRVTAWAHGYRFTPFVAGRHSSRKTHRTIAEAIPAWAKRIVRKSLAANPPMVQVPPPTPMRPIDHLQNALAELWKAQARVAQMNETPTFSQIHSAIQSIKTAINRM